MISIVISLLLTYYLGRASNIRSFTNNELIGGLYGTAIGTMGMFSNGIFVLSMSGFGPIVDNAGGIV